MEQTMNGTFASAKVHMEGLKRMIFLRGGLQSLSHSQMLQRIITWLGLPCPLFDL
jgi:hypothetical protein